jgi:gliding motility-associated-like protein
MILISIVMLPAYMSGATGIRLIPNKGQWEKEVEYRADIPGGKFYIGKRSLTYYFYDEKTLHEAVHHRVKTSVIKCHVVRVSFLGSNSGVQITGDSKGKETYSYFRGNNPAKWASGLHPSENVIMHDLWPGIDMTITAQDQGLKYTFTVHPGADPSKIKLRYEGAGNLAIKEGALEVSTTLTQIKEDAPYAFSERKGGITDVDADYELKDSIISFNVGRYNRKATLTIDPILVFSTFSGSVADNFGFTATYNKEGNAFSGGTVYDAGFPTTVGAFQRSFNGGVNDARLNQYACDEGILKYSPDGTQLIWATYIGGSGNEQPHSMVVNSNDELVILGTTSSDDYPVTSGVLDESYNGNWDIFVTILKSDGSGLVASTFLGGTGPDGLNGDKIYDYPSGPLAYNYGDEYRGEVIVDNRDNILIASTTQSKNFPVKNAFQPNFGGWQDGIIARLTPNLAAIDFASFIGGSSQDAGYGINIDFAGNIFVTGGTQSGDMPMAGEPKWRSIQGGIDGYLAKISPDGIKLLATTFIGTKEYDQSYFVQIDNFNRVYVTGQTRGAFPIVGNVFKNNGGKQFISVFSNDLSTLLISTTFGSGSRSVNISPSAFLVDLCGRVYVSGWGGADNADFYNPETGTTHNMTVTSDAFQKTTDGSDFYLIILSKELKSLVYATYFGGPVSYEHVDGGTSRFDRDGKVYQSVCAGCGGYSDFPTTENAWSRYNKGRRPHDPANGGCNNAIFKIDLNSSNFAPKFKDTTLIITATNTLDYDFDVTDADVTDSIVMTYTGDVFDPKKINPPLASLSYSNGTGRITAHLHWQTTCGHRDKDTFEIDITVRDNGCPTPRITKGKIKIVVNQPPLPEPPAIFCLERLNDHTVRLNWDEIASNPFLANYKLVKVLPNGGGDTVVKVITSQSDKSYTDVDVPNHLTTDYGYYIYGTNTCGDTGQHTRTISSIPDVDSIPKPVNIYTVTVEDDKNIRVIWNAYNKADFYTYILYRKDNTQDSKYVIYKNMKNIGDTSFLDSNVDVHHKSYCYKIVVRSQCGLQSSPGNYGCSILLSGVSIPFEHDLAFNDYKKWSDGVRQYEIIRWDPSKPEAVVGTMTNINQNSERQTFADTALDIDMGLYYYKIIAYELNGKEATSVSNIIELIQKPIVYIPNVFTPNKDSINDRWRLTPAFVKDYHLKIYNRWGELVWETFDKHASWDGVFKGHVPFDGVFVYLLEYTGWDNSRTFRHGNVTILN